MSFSYEEVQTLLEIARDDQGGGSFLERIAQLREAMGRLIPATSFSAFLQPAPDAPPPPEHLVFINRDPEALALYAQHYVHIDPMGAAFPGGGAPVVLSDHATPERFGRDAFTGEFMPGLQIRHIMAIGHVLQEGEVFALAMHREPGMEDFGPRERQLLAFVSQDLRRAMQSILLQARLAAPPSVGDELVRAGALLLNERGDVLHADRGALALSHLLRDRRGLPVELFATAARRLVSTAGLPGGPEVLEQILPTLDAGWVRIRYSLTGRGGRRQVVALLELLEPGSADHFQALADALSLTPREREVAKLVVEGLGNRHIGVLLGLSLNTVGAHLTQVYKKARVSGRNELTTLFLGGGAAGRQG